MSDVGSPRKNPGLTIATPEGLTHIRSDIRLGQLGRF